MSVAYDLLSGAGDAGPARVLALVDPASGRPAVDPEPGRPGSGIVLPFPVLSPRVPLEAPGLRLTARGRATVRGLLGLGVVIAAALIWWCAAASHPAASERPARAGLVPAGADGVVVQPGDTLWSIAERVAPDADPRATVDRLDAVNHLGPYPGAAALVPGQVLQIR